MSLDQLIDQTRERFPSYTESHVEILQLEKGGSDRQYYRIRLSVDHSLILVKYNPDRPENERFVAIANFLNGIGVNAPSIYHHDHELALIWIEDLGEDDLWNQRNESWSVRRLLYESTLDQVALLHQANPVLGECLRLQPRFDAALYRWEQRYCLENCLECYFQLPGSEVALLGGNPVFQELAEYLASLPRALIHRDFQSQNVILRNDEVYLIDFQGLRLGLPQYDLASLLCDPYVTLSQQERDYLLRYYYERNAQGRGFPEFERVYRQCAIQRLMQALGAYGVIGLIRKKTEYLRYIQPAIKTLIEVASLEENFSFFAEYLSRLPDRPKPRIQLA
jgi:aminoglycoside/choline kinase family phosphotransferase